MLDRIRGRLTAPQWLALDYLFKGQYLRTQTNGYCCPGDLFFPYRLVDDLVGLDLIVSGYDGNLYRITLLGRELVLVGPPSRIEIPPGCYVWNEPGAWR